MIWSSVLRPFASKHSFFFFSLHVMSDERGFCSLALDWEEFEPVREVGDYHMRI